MNTKSLFAVVDIETTGTDQEVDKIIQFACVFVENGQVVNQVSIDINPLRSIPKHISVLTGISNADVSQSPYFEDVAYTIYQMLEGCVFVAHNVFFDFNFLNSELKRAGVQELTLECLDTVELFQALYPTSSGFRVGDMAKELDIAHDNPHQALSDAYVTACALIKMTNKLNSYPLVTLETLTELSRFMGVDNHLFLDMILNQNKRLKERPFADNIKIVDGIALREKNRDYLDLKMPVEKGNEEMLRRTQKQMVSDISEFLDNSNNKNLLLEAETGIGKTIGYLYPFVFKHTEGPVIVATSTMMLQQQIESKDIPLFNQLFDTNIIGVVKKSHQHYIYLEAFKASLSKHNHYEQKHYAITQMAILSWLLETKTGDMDELNVNKTNVLYQHIAHPGSQSLRKNQTFIKEDFLLYLNEKCQYADFIIVNHAYLLSEQFRYNKELPENTYVVIDEAHRLPQMIEETATVYVSFKRVVFLIKSVLSSEELKAFLSDDKLSSQIVMIEAILIELRENLEWLESSLVRFFNIEDDRQDKIIKLKDYFSHIPLAKKTVSQSNLLFNELDILNSHIQSMIDNVISITYLDFFNKLASIKQVGEGFKQLFGHEESAEVRWLNYKKSHLIMSMVNMDQVSIDDFDWYSHSKKVIYTSGTLQLDSDSQYFEKRLGLQEVDSIKLPSTYNYASQSRFYVVRHPSDYKLHDIQDFSKRISQIVKKVYKAQEKNILVLFTNHQLLQATYTQLNDYYGNTAVQVLAQDITGTKEKIVKKVNQGEVAIILGAASFWEGVDFEGDLVDIVIMTKIPFDPPNRPFVQARYKQLEEKNLNPFKEDAIPVAGLKLRQGLGRLLRTPNDKGVVLMLDERFMTSDYHEQLRSYLPKQLVIDYLPMREIVEDINIFFNEG